MKWMLLHCIFVLSSVYAETIMLDDQRFVEVYQEGDLYKVEVFQIKPGRLQHKIQDHSFSNQESLQAYLKQYQNLKGAVFLDRSKLVSTEVAGVGLWEVKNSWDLSWEKKYADWISENLTRDFFVKYNIQVDCADVVYSLRWIFARIYQLPAAATLAGSKIIFSHESMKREWLALATDPDWSKDKRFLAAINYLNNNTYTNSLFFDAYPAAINALSIDVGAIYLTPGHVEIISRLDRDGSIGVPIFRLGSTTPKKARLLHENVMLEMKNVSKSQGGMMRFRWPLKSAGKWKMMAQKAMPYFSLEQYTEEYNTPEGFSLTIAKAMGLAYDSEKVIHWAIEDAVNYVEFRKIIVKNGFEYCRKNNCIKNRWMRNLYATSSRDKKLTKRMDRVYKLVNYFSQYNREFETYIEKFFLHRSVEILGNKITMGELYPLFKEGKVSHDPIDSIWKRWGMPFHPQLLVFGS